MVNLSVEMQGRQIGERDRSGATEIFLATAEPRFCWQYEAGVNNVVQTDYRIIVASTGFETCRHRPDALHPLRRQSVEEPRPLLVEGVHHRDLRQA